MKKTNSVMSIILAAVCAAGCGGDGTTSTASQPEAAAKALTPQRKAVAADYSAVVQELYIAYFGRPADATGLTNFESALLAANAPTDIQGLVNAYSTNAGVQSLVNAFGTSQESLNLYGTGNATAFVTAVFNNVLGRTPQQSGLTFWSSAISSGTLSQGNAALAIMAGGLNNANGQGATDVASINNRVSVASNFTVAMSTKGKMNAYSGATAGAAARTMLSSVNSTTDVDAFESTVTATIGNLVALAFSNVQAIITQRCVPCHSSHPTEPGFSPAPDGFMFDTAAEIQQNASDIYQYAVLQKPISMPYGNLTGMTTAERTTIGNWYQAGADQ